MRRWAAALVTACVLALPTAAAGRLHITRLFSYPAVHHPRPHRLPKQIINCQVTSGGAYRVCCIWNPDESPYLPGVGELPIIGAWDCTAEPNPQLQ